MSDFHTSVLLKEAVDFLRIVPGKRYLDATLGGGGHTLEIARRGGEVLALDVDEDAIRNFKERISSVELDISQRVQIIRGNFENIDAITRDNGFMNVSGILFDLGVSGHQFDAPERGFSFQKEGPLDMRMDQNLIVKASDLVNGLNRTELIQLFERYGEEHFARRIAQAIIDFRKHKGISSTHEIAELIERAVGRREKIHPATRVFQALRIAVNDELHVLEHALAQAVRLLEDRGRIVVISFHSLEDRVVKQAFNEFLDQGHGAVLTKKPIIPSQKEQDENPRSRSAKLRVFEKIK